MKLNFNCLLSIYVAIFTFRLFNFICTLWDSSKVEYKKENNRKKNNKMKKIKNLKKKTITR